MEALEKWQEQVSKEQDVHPDKTFGNKPHYNNYIQIDYLKTQLKELELAEKEILQVLDNIKETKKSLIGLLSKYKIISGRIF